MALIHVSQKELCALCGLKPSAVEDTLTALGIPLESVEGDDLSLEITPNRPDWLSVEGVARSCYSYRTGKPKLYSAAKSSVAWKVLPSVLSVRPYVGSAVVRAVPNTPQLLVSLIQLQEKLHDTLGRNRRKMAIGIHDLATVQPPFTYQAVDRNGTRFVPLGKTSPMTPGEILMSHEKGIAYAHLVGDLCPLITDRNNDVLSFPPIINGERTRLTEHSTDLLIDCTGTSESVVRTTVNILVAALADRGGKVEAVAMNGSPYPLFEGTSWSLPIVRAQAEKLLGQPVSPADAARHLSRLGHSVSGSRIFSPSFRSDLLHEVDLVEDIAISIGLNNLPVQLSTFSSVGMQADPPAPLHEAMLGLGYFEVLSWILVNEGTLRASQLDPAACLRVQNPLTEEFTTLRPCLYPNLLDIFSCSKSESLPQYLYEIGPVHAPSGAGSASRFVETERLCAAAIDPKAGWSQTLSHLEGVCSSLGRSLERAPVARAGFIPGRCARLLHEGKEVGFVGEVHPQVLEEFGLEQPVALFELETAFLKTKS